VPYLVDIQTAFPENYYSQEELIKEITGEWEGEVSDIPKVKSIHQNVLVNKRHLAMRIDEYFSSTTFDERNTRYIEVATKLATEAVNAVLNNNSFDAKDVSSLWSNTVTGFAIPSLEARVMNNISFNSDTKRIPILGLGCMAGISGINRISDYLVGHPDEAVIFFSVELCSLTFQLKDTSFANLVSTGLFGDGAAAVLMVGDNHPLKDESKMQWLGSESIFFPDTERIMGWDVGSSGLKVILSKGVPEIARDRLGKPVKDFLKKNDLSLDDISTFMAHPGGPKVLQAMEHVFNLPERGLIHSWESLAENGNMSSVSVLDIIKRTIKNQENGLSGKYALGVAMGPAFSGEVGLFKWI